MTAVPSSTIRVRILFFAIYAELLGRDSADVVLATPATVRDVIRAARATLPQGDRLPERPLAAVNLSHAKPDQAVSEGDEVALLPPMAGG